MTCELDNDGFLNECRKRRREMSSPGEYKLDADKLAADPQVATTGGAVRNDQRYGPAEFYRDAENYRIARQRGVRKNVGTILGYAMLIVASLGGGIPIGMAIKEAPAVEKVVEKVVKVPVPTPAPAPAPKPLAFRVDCPRCGAIIIARPANTGRVGDLPPAEKDHDEPANESPGRSRDGGHHGDPAPRLPVPLKPTIRPAIGPNSFAVSAGPS